MSASGYGFFAAAHHGLSSRPESLIPEGDGLRSGGTCCFAHTQQYSKSLMSSTRPWSQGWSGLAYAYSGLFDWRRR